MTTESAHVSVSEPVVARPPTRRFESAPTISTTSPHDPSSTESVRPKKSSIYSRRSNSDITNKKRVMFPVNTQTANWTRTATLKSPHPSSFSPSLRRTSPDTDTTAESPDSLNEYTFFKRYTNFSGPGPTGIEPSDTPPTSLEISPISPSHDTQSVTATWATTAPAAKGLPPLKVWTGVGPGSSFSLSTPVTPPSATMSSASPRSPKSSIVEATVTHITVSPSRKGPIVDILHSPAGDYDVTRDEQPDNPVPSLRAPESGLETVTRKLSYWSWAGQRPSRSEPSLAIHPIEVQALKDIKEGGNSSETKAAHPTKRGGTDETGSSEDAPRSQLLDEVQFSFHRDSVALARDRLFKTKGVQPEQFARKDSLAVAKERIACKSKPQAMVELPDDRVIHFFPRSGCRAPRKRPERTQEEIDAIEENRNSRHIVIIEPVKPVEDDESTRV